MPPDSGPCPGPAEIDDLANGTDSPQATRDHVAQCESCRARVEEAREEATFLRRAKSLAAPMLGAPGMPYVSGYRSMQVISSGAQGIVYRAVQDSTSRPVAIKILLSGAAISERQRFRAEREAEIVARLRHPNVVTVFESRSLADGRIAVVMEFVDGVALDAWKPAGETLDSRRASLLEVFIAVCNGVHHAHLNGVIHRDLKPANVLVTPEGRPVVLDFGIARAGAAHMTATGEFAGTPAYASPEQASGRAGHVDALTDVYSLGVMLYKLLCGVMPYDIEGSFFDTMRAIAESQPARPTSADPTFPSDLEAILLKALSKDKMRRYQSAAGLAGDIERFLIGDPVDARSGSGWYLLRKAVSLNRKKLAWAAGAGVLVLGAVAAVMVSLSLAAEAARREAQEREQARAESIRAQAVTELLREALPNADPQHPELTAAINIGLLRLHFRLETGAFAGDRELDQALRRLWGSIYTGLGSGKATGVAEYAEVSLRNGLVRLRREHGADHPEIAGSLHELAGVLLVRDRVSEAEGFCRQAVDMRRRLLGPTNRRTADSHGLLARILLERGLPVDAVTQADAALRIVAGLTDRDADLLFASMMALKARVEADAHHLAEAEPMLRDALVRRLRHLPPDDPDLLATLSDAATIADAFRNSDLAGTLASAFACPPERLAELIRQDVAALRSPDRGDFIHAANSMRTHALGRLVRLQELLLGPESPALVGTLMAQMVAANSERLLEERVSAALRAADLLAVQFGADDLSVLVCLEQAAVISVYSGPISRAVELGTRACDIWDRIPEGARDRLLAENTRRRMAWYRSMAGDDEAAIPIYRQAMEQLISEVGERHRTVALAQAGLAVSLAQLGSLAEADSLSALALETATQMPSTPEDQLAHIQFARGHVLTLKGQFAEARPLFERAWEPIFRFSGNVFFWRRMLVRDMFEVCKSLGDTEGEAKWRGELDSESRGGP